MKHYLKTFAQAKDKQLSTMSLNPTLISGFEDVINHIKQQEQRVMGLEEQNKNLKEEINELKEHLLCVKNRKDEEIQQYKDTLEEHFVHYDNLKEEKKQDEEKIARLEKVTEQLAEKFLKHYKETDTDMMFIGRKTGYDLGNMVDHLMEGYKKLEEENKKLSATIQRIERMEVEQEQEDRAWMEDFKQTKEKKDFYEKLLRDGPVSIERIRWIKKENNKLREENKKLSEAEECLKFMGYVWSPDKGWNEKESD